jgi:hypothetical protein
MTFFYLNILLQVKKQNLGLMLKYNRVKARMSILWRGFVPSVCLIIG